MARKRIGRILSGIVLALCATLLLTPTSHSQGFRARVVKLTISGSVGIEGVTMQGLPGKPMTDENGVYSAEVDYNFSGTVTPTKPGYTFEPGLRRYENLTENRTEENYTANLLTYTVTCSVGMADVTLMGLPGDPVTDQTGRISATVPFGWSSLVTPQKAGYQFNPPSKLIDPVKADQSMTFKPSELKFEISGNVGPAGVTMKGLPGNPVTDQEGNYKAVVSYNWSGTVTPEKEGYTFTPEVRSYSDVMADAKDEHYTAQVFTYQITGSAGLPGVTMEGFPETTITDGTGYYLAIVEYGWNGKVKPSLAGYTFSPPERTYTKVISNSEQQDYNGTLIRLTISGRVGMPGVTVEGLPTEVVTDASGTFSVQVDWGWSGTIAPVKEGISFEPPTRAYSALTTDQTNQNFSGTPITYTVAGNVGQAQVLLKGLGRPGRPVYSDQNGSYTATVDYKWSGEVTPQKTGYTFDPEMRTYTDVQGDRLTDDYLPRIKHYTLSGRVLDDRGQAVSDVLVYAADTINGSGTTDAEGRYELLVQHGWRGRLTPQKTGYEFVPEAKDVASVAQDTTVSTIVAKPMMMSITDSIVWGTEPIEDVLITSEPGNYQAKTNARGIFTIEVPYGWTGELKPTKPGFIFETDDPTANQYFNVTQDIDKTGTRPTAPRTPSGTTSVPTPGGTTSVPTPRETTSVPTPRETTTVPVPGETASVPAPRETTSVPTPSTADPEKQALIDMLEQYRRELALLKGETGAQPSVEGPTMPAITAGPSTPRRLGGPPVRGDFIQRDLVAVLEDLSDQAYAQANVAIATDRTVKPGDMTVNVQLGQGTPLESALEMILQDQYDYRRKGNVYTVYRPITQTFLGQDLRDEVLPLIASTAGVSIITDENVIGQVFAELDEFSLATALDTVLAGTPFVWVEFPDYILVGSRMVTEPESSAVIYPTAFNEITETRAVYMNWLSPLRAKQLISGAFNRYVMADPDPNSHVVTVTAPRGMADRIVADLKEIDRAQRPEQVLLDARVVVMESTDLLNMGIEWNFPQIRAGIFTDSFLDGDKADGIVGTSWPYGVQVGFSSDRTFTDSLLMALNLLEQNGQADIVSNPQVLATDGRKSEIRNVIEDHYVLTGPQAQNFYVQSEFVTVTSGTTLSITPRIMDNNDILLELAVEVSESVPRGQGTELPRVTRRTTRSSARVSDGGTVAVAGLTETRSKTTEKRVPGLSNLPLLGGLFRNTDQDQSTKEVAVFVTAYLARDTYRAPNAPQTTVEDRISSVPATTDFREGLRRSLANQNGY